MTGEEGPVQLSKGVCVGNWRIVKKLGEGGCGAVYMVKHTETRKLAALKAESNFVDGGSVLKLEVDVLTKLQGKRNVSELLHAGKKSNYQYVVMTLLGESLNHLLRTCKNEVSISTQIRLGIHVLFGLKQLHDVGYIHRDIKPANLAVGRKGTSDPKIIHILDFGLAREFVVREGGKITLRKPRRKALFRGTVRYCSIATHDRAEQGRCDDLWSLLYVMVEMRGRLPWATIRDKREIADYKRNIPDSHLFAKCPPSLREIADHLRTLDYFKRPDYAKMYITLNRIMEVGGYQYNDPWDWNVSKTLLTTEITRDATAMDDVPFDENCFKDDPLGF